MKPIQYCLDSLLKQYYENTSKGENDRIPFDVHARFKEFDIKTDVEFKSLIDNLVADGFVIFLDGHKDVLDEYRKRTVITAKGTYFHLTEGYQNRLQNEIKVRKSKERYENQIRILSFWVALGTVGLVIVEIVRLLIEHPPHFCH